LNSKLNRTFQKTYDFVTTTTTTTTTVAFAFTIFGILLLKLAMG